MKYLIHFLLNLSQNKKQLVYKLSFETSFVVIEWVLFESFKLESFFIEGGDAKYFFFILQIRSSPHKKY